jgi:Ca-activated chloride channel family protein
MRPLQITLVAFVTGLTWSHTQRAAAELPPFLRSENHEVRDGNQALQKGDAKGALDAYNRAARQLPEAAGVQLDRGLALLKQGEYGKAREALLAATAPGAPTNLRADAYQDLALSFYREADGLATQNKHEEAQKLFREALDSAKRSLRLRPGDPDTAWNLELSARRIREEDEKKKQDDEKKKQDDEKKDQDKDKDKSDSDQQDQKQDSDQKQDQKPDDPKDGDKKKPDKPDDKKGQDQQDQAKQDQPQPPKQDPAKPEQKPKDSAEEPGEEKPEQHALPKEAAQALDSLEGGEENFERYRARQRVARERRAPEKDW